MAENNVDIKQIIETIERIKLEIIEKLNEIDELLVIINNESEDNLKEQN